MIRMVLLAACFLVITIALVIFQPGSGRQLANAPQSEPAVTRATPALETPRSEPGAASALSPASARPASTASAHQVSAVTESADLDDEALRRMTWETLSNISRATGKEAAPGQPGSVLHTIVRRSLDDTPKQSASAPVTPVARQQASAPNIYVVQPGDTLVSIAERVYGDVNMTGPLFAANQAILSLPDDLRAGQTLVLPSR